MTATPFASAPTAAIKSITPRDVDFDLDAARAKDWLDGSQEKSLFWNALSILFPAGERFFIASVLANRKAVTDPILLQDVKEFCRQEAFHTREHLSYNAALNTFVDSDRLENELTAFLAWVKKTIPKDGPLLVTCALEHFTAILAKGLLEHPEQMRGAEATYDRMWTWHALEECEHKAVAYDVFRAAETGPLADVRRRIAMVVVSIIFFGYIAKHVVVLMRAQGLFWKPASWAKLLWYAYGTPGIFRRMILPWAQYFKPNFHPDDIDDTAALARTRTTVAAW